MSRAPLCDKEKSVYDYLVKKAGGGIPPTVREIAAAVGIKSTSTVYGILESLEEAGYITRNAGRSRGIKINGSSDASMVPLVGRVTAGKPILAVEQIEDYIPYPAQNSEGLFALRVSGLSMINAGILDGDIVVADKNSPCKNGDIIIGMDGEEATVKRLLLKDGKVIFMPENPDFSPIYPEKPSVLGRVIGCYRKY